MTQRSKRPQRVADQKRVEPSHSVSAGRGRPAMFTRDEILEAAKVAFSNGGYANVTLDDLAARLNTGKGTLYYHSNRKVDLLIAISTEVVGDGAMELRRIASHKSPPEHRLALAMRTLMRDVLGDRQASKVYFENESDLPPRIRNKFRRRLREIQSAFVEIVTDGVSAGVFRGEPNIVAKHILSVCAWPYRWFSADGALSLDAFVDSAISFVLGGILANPQAERVIEAALASSPNDREASDSRRARAKT